MAAIHSLLNPMPESEQRTFQLPSPSPSTHTVELSSPMYPRKKQKLCKDAAVFVKGNIRGECRYPAYEGQDETLAAHYQQHEVRPVGRIMEYPRHVPYNSEKKSFLEKTQRDGFEVFHYEFKAHSDDKVHTMMWDYNIGLVRTTPLFKCTGYSKTTPAKMLNRNPGLREICHSITGGALVAQGYWMPFEAAKAIAATFCWKIRYALTPVFGLDFPNMCLRPESEGFGAMVIDPAITQRCTEQAILYRQLEIKSPSRAASVVRSPLTPESPTIPKSVKQLRPKLRQSANAGSGYSSDSSFESSYLAIPISPSIPYCSAWTPANTPRSVGPLFHARLPSPRAILAGLPAEAADDDEEDHQSAHSTSTSSTTSMLLKSRQEIHDEDEGEEEEEEEEGEEEDVTPSSNDPPRAAFNLYEAQRKRSERSLLSDEKAAYLLLKLSTEAGMNEAPRGEKRRAST